MRQISTVMPTHNKKQTNKLLGNQLIKSYLFSYLNCGGTFLSLINFEVVEAAEAEDEEPPLQREEAMEAEGVRGE